MKQILKPALILLIICVVTTFAVAGVQTLTKDAIAKAEAEAAMKSMQALIPDAKLNKVESALTKSEAIYFAEGKGYVFTSSADGYGGEVKVLTAVGLDAKIIGVTVINCDNETPGLGQNVKKDGFLKQFKGKSGKLELEKDGGDIVAVTSATYTSKAVKEAVNIALDDFETLSKGVADNEA